MKNMTPTNTAKIIELIRFDILISSVFTIIMMKILIEKNKDATTNLFFIIFLTLNTFSN